MCHVWPKFAKICMNPMHSNSALNVCLHTFTIQHNMIIDVMFLIHYNKNIKINLLWHLSKCRYFQNRDINFTNFLRKVGCEWYGM